MNYFINKYKRSGIKRREVAENAFVQVIRGILCNKERIVVHSMKYDQDDFIKDMKKLGLDVKKVGLDLILTPAKVTSTRECEKSKTENKNFKNLKMSKPLKIDSDLISIIEDLK